MPDIGDGAARVADARGWQPERYSGPRYFWLSPDEVLYFRGAGAGFVPVRRRISTGQEVVCAPLPEVRAPVWDRLRVWLSPDGRRLLWRRGGKDPNKAIIVALVSVGASTEKPATWAWGNSLPADASQFSWLPDGRRWVRIGPMRAPGKTRSWQCGMLLYDADRPDAAVQRSVLPGIGPNSILAGAMPDGSLLIQESTFQVRAIHNANAARAANGRNSAAFQYQQIVTMWRVTAGNPPAVTKMAAFRPPIWNRSLRPVGLSPDGRRLLWFGGEEADSYSELLNRLRAAVPALPLPPPRRPASRDIYLWLSDADGRQLRPVARCVRDNIALIPRESIRWTPDGRGVSFIAGGSLYVRPIP